MFTKRDSFIAATICLFLLSGCSGKPVETIAQVKNVKTAEAKKALIVVAVDYAGKLKPYQEITLSSKIAGKVAVIRKDVGQEVNADDVLMELDSSEIILVAEKIRIQLEDAKRNLERQKALLDSGALPQASYDNAKSSYDILNVSMQQTLNELANTKIRSPIKGIVSVRNVDIGMVVSSSVPAFTIIDPSTLVLELAVTDKMLTKVKKGDLLLVKAPAYGESFNGIVDIISPSVDPKTGLHTVKVNISNSGGKLKGGVLCKVSLVAEQKEDCLTIPKEALVVENSVSYLYSVENGRVKKKVVTTGLVDNNSVEITSNLDLNEKVITQGQTFLNEGDKVNPVN